MTGTQTPDEAVITRVFDAPREQVWRAVTEPEGIAAWWGTSPFTTPVSTVTIEPRPGGVFEATMVHETDGTELPFAGHFLEVEAPSRYVLQLENPDEPDDPNVETILLTLDEVAGGTEATYRQTGHLPSEQYPLIEQGVAGFWERLAAYLEDDR